MLARLVAVAALLAALWCASGVARTGSHAFANALALQPDGKLVAGGWSDAAGPTGGIALARYLPDGSLDASFGRGGKVLTGFGVDAQAAAVAVQRDGRIVAAGWAKVSTKRIDFALVRYRRNGSLDQSFGDRGKVVTRFGRYSGALGIASQPDGKLVVAGWTGGYSGGAPNGNLALARYTRAGKLDPTFGNRGKVVANFNSFGDAVAIQADGAVVLASDSRVVRYAASGALDATFGRGGKVPTANSALTLVVQSDGKIVAAGNTQGRSCCDFAVARYLGDGRPDVSFGSDGTATTDFTTPANLCDLCEHSGESVRTLALQPDGKLVAAGSSDALDNRGTHPNTANDDIAVARYTADGSLDDGFGRGGKVLTSFDKGGNWESEAAGVVLQGDGKIVVAGSRGRGAGDVPRDFLLLRYTAGGLLDTSFGSRGKVTTSFGR